MDKPACFKPRCLSCPYNQCCENSTVTYMITTGTGVTFPIITNITVS